MAEQTIELRIEGMSCEHCVAAVRKALQAVPGVTGVEVDLPSGKATVTMDRERAAVEQLVAAVDEEGYTTELA